MKAFLGNTIHQQFIAIPFDVDFMLYPINQNFLQSGQFSAPILTKLKDTVHFATVTGVMSKSQDIQQPKNIFFVFERGFVVIHSSLHPKKQKTITK